MEFREKIIDYSIRRYKLVTIIMVLFTLALGALISQILVDTDLENMLPEDEPVRIFHNQTKKDFVLSDIVVLGIVNNKDPNGVFNPSSLSKIYELTELAKKLRWPSDKDPNQDIGVVEVDLLAASTVDYIGRGGPGVVKFEWLMQNPPQTNAEALKIRNKAMSNLLLKGTVISEDGKAICLYLPLTSKDLSYKVYTRLKEKIAEFTGDEKYYITGLPVAEDTFGCKMFVQMAISAPLAMLTIFILMLVFFRKLVLIISPMIVALVSVISTMGLLIGSGYPFHIMSSMIPIFLMPISVVDSVHILSDFFDLYSKEKGRKNTIREVMSNLFRPMLYTSLTSAAGFASLALTPIPPVQVFGIFVAIGIMIAWIVNVTFVPAYIMMISDKSLENFGHQARHGDKQTALMKLLNAAGGFTYRAAKPILILLAAVTIVAVYGVTRIEINDNPVKWLSKRHPIRQADTELNKHFGGTYMAYLVLEDKTPKAIDTEYVDVVRKRLLEKGAELKEEFPKTLSVIGEMEKLLLASVTKEMTKQEFLDKLTEIANQKESSASQAEADIWYELIDFFEMQKERLKLFKKPEILRYMSSLQEHAESTGLVGKSNSVADIVKKVHQGLIDGSAENYKIPETSAAVGQCLIQFQSSHTPDDLWHFVTCDYSKANIWMQLKSGDNKQMRKVVKAVAEFFAKNPPPAPLDYNWAGLTYINVIRQEKMVWGMLQSLVGSFIIVFIMTAILFRSSLWGLVCMVPLSITITVIYGIIGLAGKDYDMPVAVLSALTLGMAVDFAIHFLERSRVSFAETNSWRNSSSIMFGGPARAISRNVLVIAIGFLPLLAAPLIPYKTAGIFLCAIMALSGAVTLMVLPAILALAEKKMFKPASAPASPSCNCGFCLIISAAAAVLIALNLHQYWKLNWSNLTMISIVTISVIGLICGIVSHRQKCKRNLR